MTTQLYDPQLVGREEIRDPIDLPLDHKNTSTRWDIYGITEVPLLVRAQNGQVYDDKKLKAILYEGRYGQVVSRRYVVFPNPEVDKIVHRIINEENTGLTLQKEYESHYGHAKYWQLIREDFKHNIEYKGRDDVVQTGCVLRNSVGTSVALGADIFTYRVICENGAVARERDFGLKLRHVGSFETLYDIFVAGIAKVLQRSEEMIEYYRKAQKIRMNKKIANELARRIPHNVFPECMIYDKKQKQVILSREENLWKAFNDITENVWHNDKAKFFQKSGIEQATHRILVEAVRGRYV
jgi:hypothetical protein